MRILITGCGYVGLPLGQALAARGHTVHGVRRNPFTAEGITTHTADLTQPGTLDTLPRDFDWVINTVSSSRGGAEVEIMRSDPAGARPCCSNRPVVKKKAIRYDSEHPGHFFACIAMCMCP